MTEYHQRPSCQTLRMRSLASALKSARACSSGCEGTTLSRSISFSVVVLLSSAGVRCCELSVPMWGLRLSTYRGADGRREVDVGGNMRDGLAQASMPMIPLN